MRHMDHPGYSGLVSVFVLVIVRMIAEGMYDLHGRSEEHDHGPLHSSVAVLG